ncbi:MAG: AsnC family transcriptional regulator [Alphaproteobacteria bacterium]|nr:AsnC family transcriptional regulator [Alphaproteobacteria bacterium]
MSGLDSIDRSIIEATQAGLAMTPRPYAEIARSVGIGEADVILRLGRLMQRGVIRRIAIAPNHYALGLTANGMTVWDIEDEVASEVGREVGALPFVTHCYLRPRALPSWPYNLFAMVHGTTRDEVEAKRREIALLAGPACRACDILYSKRILKKTGLRLSANGG